MNHQLLVFVVGSNAWAFFQVEGVFHSSVASLLIRFKRVVETSFSLWQLVAFVSDWIFYVVVVSSWSGTALFNFLIIFHKIELLAVADANLLGFASFVVELVLVLNRNFRINCLKGRWNLESFVGSHGEFEICEALIVFLICIFGTWRWTESLELCVSLRTPRKLGLVSNWMLWSGFLFW